MTFLTSKNLGRVVYLLLGSVLIGVYKNPTIDDKKNKQYNMGGLIMGGIFLGLFCANILPPDFDKQYALLYIVLLLIGTILSHLSTFSGDPNSNVDLFIASRLIINTWGLAGIVMLYTKTLDFNT